MLIKIKKHYTFLRNDVRPQINKTKSLFMGILPNSSIDFQHYNESHEQYESRIEILNYFDE